MKRTLLAVGIAILVSMMLVPRNSFWYWYWPPHSPVQLRAPFFMWRRDYPVDITGFIWQTVFAAVLFAVIVNLLPRRPRK
jgi:hypothetical protein